MFLFPPFPYFYLHKYLFTFPTYVHTSVLHCILQSHISFHSLAIVYFYRRPILKTLLYVLLRTISPFYNLLISLSLYFSFQGRFLIFHSFFSLLCFPYLLDVVSSLFPCLFYVCCVPLSFVTRSHERAHITVVYSSIGAP